MKILVTGSQGFIGRNLVEELELDGHEVSKWDLHGRNELGQPAFRNFKDITKETLEDIDRVVHLAALADVRKSFDNPDKWYETNVEWSTNLFKLCAENKTPCVYASSSNAHYWWKNPYAGSKKAMEAVAKATGKHIGLRFTNVFGDGCRPTMLTQKMIDGTLEYKTEHTRDFIHVLDVVDAIKLFIYRKEFYMDWTQHTYEIASGKGIKVNELVDKYFKNIPTKEGHSGESLDNTANIKDILSLGWRPKRDLDKYLKGKIHGHSKFKEYIKRILPKKLR
ncbi:MAG: NAD-dependent epimerase/dehydratase family protein [Alphaproteobacteria bacterium TMED194]|nr:MAG: NAD-dependent epimerase/dehydratase family protein [Alphaproteobacteria bacterium TMED194]|tara:strand:- start:1023 stop:1859 length:837 start_codon:yes stop_codon:yes gene_type:complete